MTTIEKGLRSPLTSALLLRHPARKIPFFHYIPVEFREEDEGLQWVTYRACRKTYIFLYSAVPAGLLAITLSNSNPIVRLRC